MKIITENGQKYVSLPGGIKVAIKSNEECAKADYRICMRVMDGKSVVEGSQIGNCCECEKEIWFDPRQPMQPKMICMHCATKLKEQPDWNNSATSPIVEDL